MEWLDWLYIAGAAFFYLFFAWWVLDVAVRFVFRRVDTKRGSLALDQPEDGRTDQVD